MDSALLNNLNDEQKRAVTHRDGPLLIVAGAGTGKTTVITRRVAWLIEQGKCKPEEILALTFTDKAAGEMEERVDRLLPYGYVNLWISTFHSFCERILQKHALDIGLPNEFRLLDTTASWLLVRKNLDRFELDYYRPLGNPTKFIHALLKHFSRAKDEGIEPRDYLEHAQSLKLDTDTTPERGDEHKKINELAGAYHVYQQLLLENNALDFGDLIVFAVRLFKERPAILSQYRKSFPYVLVDEFQDTNHVQYELVKLLSAPRNNLTVVGDDDQAIFRWRGASFQNIISFKKDFPESTEIVLTQNYRSPQNILDSAYEFIQKNNPNRLEHQLQETGGAKGVALSKRLVSADALPGIIEHIHCATHEEEVVEIIKKIVDLKEGGSAESFGDFAILVRSNDAADPFLAKLAEVQIPYLFLAQKGLYAKSIIIDLVCYLNVLNDAHDSPSLYRVLTWPIWDVGHDALMELNHYARKKGSTLWTACKQLDLVSEISQKDREKIEMVRGLLERHGALCRTARMTELFLTVLKDTGLLASISSDATQEDRDKLSLVNEFFSKIKAFQESDPRGRLRDFMALLSFEQEAGDEGSLSRLSELDPDSVKIMTIHGSKGLEFPYVFLIGMVDQRFPTRERGDAIPLPESLAKDLSASDSSHLEEERRLMYVALTRARRGFFCSSAFDYGGSRKRKPSQFLHELGLVSEVAIIKKSDPAALPVRARESKLPPLHLPSSFSFSQLAAFRNCPLQYKFAFLLKIPVFGKPSLSFGKTMHATLQKFVEAVLENSGKSQADLFGKTETGHTQDKRAIPSLDDLFALYDAAWIDDWYPTERIQSEYKAKGKEMLKSFYQDFCAVKPQPKMVERDFVVKIGTPLDQYTLKGRIDRIDSTQNGINVIDYKTGKSKDGETLAFQDKEQLLLYQIALEEVFGEHVESLTYYYLEDGKRITFLGTEKDKEKLRGKIKETLDTMQESTFEATPGWDCKYCDFRDICEFRD